MAEVCHGRFDLCRQSNNGAWKDAGRQDAGREFRGGDGQLAKSYLYIHVRLRLLRIFHLWESLKGGGTEGGWQ